MDTSLLKMEDYTPTLKHRNEKYYFIIFELSLVSSGESAGEAYDNLLDKYDGLIQDLKEAGQEKMLPPPEEESASPFAQYRGPRFGAEIGTFLVKLIIVLGIFGTVAITGGAHLKNAVAGVGGSIITQARIAISPFPILEKVAVKVDQVPKENIDQAKQNIRLIVSRILPLATELQPLTTAIFPPAQTIEKPN